MKKLYYVSQDVCPGGGGGGGLGRPWSSVWFLISVDLGYSCLNTAWAMVQCC